MTHELRFWAGKRRCRFTFRANVMLVVFMHYASRFPNSCLFCRGT